MSTIAVVADSHDEVVDWAPVRDRLAELFAGADLIVHCGDATTAQVHDDLAAIAPVVATRSPGDPPPDPPRLTDGPRVVRHAGIDVGIVFDLPAGVAVDDLFGQPVRLVLYGGTHAPGIEQRDDGTVLVNPGSPTLAERATVALVEIDDDGIRPRIVDV
jgi:putative phosphoesterase